MAPDLMIAELGYRDKVGVVEAVGLTARWLVENPVRRGSTKERRMQDPFDYEAEDAIIDAFRSSIGKAAELAAAFDPDFRGRYSPGSDDWRLVDAKN